MDSNAGGASKAGASHEKLVALTDYHKSALFTPSEKAALELADAMTATPHRVTDALFRRAQAHFEEAAMVELGAIIALENYRARFNRCMSIEPQNSYVRTDELLRAYGVTAPPEPK